MKTTIGDLIAELVEVYERQYDDHELATVKTALVVEQLLRADLARSTRAQARRAVRALARKAA